MTHRLDINKVGFKLFLTSLVVIFISALSQIAFADALLDAGYIINTKMKALAASISVAQEDGAAEIKAIRMADSLPSDFIPSDINTVSALQSSEPIYIFFDNENDAGIIYFYTNDDTIIMNPYSGMMFYDCKALTDISGVAGWNSSQVISMYGMFNGAKCLPDALAIKNWDTSSVTDMSYLFSDNISLKFVDVSNWNTSNVTNMTCMFQVGESWNANGQLIEINGLSNLDVSNVTDMTCMFYGASQMTYYDISRWDVSKVQSMNHMFCDNSNLKSLDLSGWNVSSLKTILDMFDDCYALVTIGDVSHWNTINLIDAGGWLNECSSFVGNNEGLLDLSGWNTSHLKAAGEMFSSTKVRTVDLSGWTFDSITNELWEGAGRGIYYETGNSTEGYRGLSQMFKYTSKMTHVYISQSGLDSYNKAVENGVETMNMWLGSKSNGFTVK